MDTARLTLALATAALVLVGCSGSKKNRVDADADADAPPDTTEVVPDPPAEDLTVTDPAPETTGDPTADPAPDPGEDPTAEPSEDPSGDAASDPSADPAADTVWDVPIDFPMDHPADMSCVGEGCPTAHTGLGCCSGLTPVSDCEPGTPCPAVLYCVDCGDGSCDSHETAWNCPADCPTGCTVGTVDTTYCPGTGYIQCTCVVDPCRPYCDLDGTPPDGWLDGCTHTLITTCSDTTMAPLCLHIGTRSEGWYEPPGSGGTAGPRIEWDFCAPRWSCVIL
jgi:hypothetical protein